ncbi:MULTISPECIES: cytochrome aa3 quinol oxidase subunit III [Bacillaceae]|uniref:Quinol oxidase subunit 3 n=1 Tax=Alkalicoccobacillus plakortidis TaxID=444060 RepID=A0A9D5DK03_9BACI|nr:MULTISPECIES: cytochrome aa3 quinol oxidase subunit III [Bacillaceae]KQL51752.1 cytochrome o ubiquinol oxidase subunit III [Alkalicoccobacillus plakortidis]RQW20563.1 cytochrome aa3 quinol oxidase subunit III [Bacillus sp. C1-1]
MAANESIDPNQPLEYQSAEGKNNILGFWIFIGAEFALFSTLFASYFVLVDRNASAITSAELFDLNLVLAMTFLLLTSSFTAGIAIHEMRAGRVNRMLIWIGLTLLLGLGFLGFEIYEFVHYAHEGATLSASAHWSTFFVLLGTHGLHVAVGVGWMTVLAIQIKMRGLTKRTTSKFFIASLYWHFLDVIWIIIFTGVYLLGMEWM